MFKDVYLTRLEMEGFKGFKKKTVIEFDHNGKTTIQADNYMGKTTIGEAIPWAFLGSNLWGNDKVDSILLNRESKRMRVSVDFISDGEEHNITRTRQGSNTTIMLDKRTVKQNELTSMLGSKDIFLGIYNPEYFIGMSEKEGRDFLISILEDVGKESIKERMDRVSLEYLEDDIDYIHADPNNYMKQHRAEIKELEKDILFAEGVLSKLNIGEVDEKIVEYDTTRIEQLEDEYENLLSNQATGGKNNKEIEDLKEKKRQRDIELSLLQNENPENSEELRNIKQALSSLNMEKFEPSEDRQREIFTLESKLASLRDEYKKAKDMPLEKGDKCPTCKTIISSSHIAILEEEREFKLHELMEKGNQVATQLSELKRTIEDNLKAYNDLRERKKVELEQKYEKLKEEMELQKKEKIEILKTVIMGIDHDIMVVENQFKEKSETLTVEKKQVIKDELLRLKKEKASVDAANLDKKYRQEQALKNKADYDKVSAEIDSSREKIMRKKSQIDATKQYTGIKAELLSDMIHQKLSDVTIELQKVVKSTGELKDCFEIRYKGREMKILSTSEKIRAGLEIANLLIHQLGLKYPVFIDNKESITHYNQPKAQIIEAEVVEGMEILSAQSKIAV